MGSSILIIFPLTIIYGIILLLVFIRLKNNDVAGKRQLEEVEEKLRTAEVTLQKERQEGMHQITVTNFSKAVLDTLSQSVILTDPSGNMLYINPQAEKKIHATDAETRQRSFKHYFKLVDATGTAAFAAFDTALQGKSTNFGKWIYLSVGGQKLPVFVSAQPVFDQSHTLTQVVVLLVDASAQVESEEEAKAFFSAAAHELRTPLSIIHSSASLLLDTLDQQPKEKLKEIISGINQASTQLIDLVNDFLSVSRIEQGRLDVKKETFDIIEIIKEIISQQSAVAKERNLFLNHESEVGSLSVLADEAKVREVLLNLVTNGLKYTFQGGVTVSATGSETQAEVRVTDSGVGIDKQAQMLLFRKFQQVGEAHTQAQTKSTGLGLYIAQKLAQLMGGDLVLEKSEPGQGTTFLFTVPLEPRINQNTI